MLFFSKSRQGESCPASHHGGTTKTLVRDFGPSKRRKLVPRRSPLPCPRADPPLTRGNYGTSSNPARKHKFMSAINMLAGGGGGIRTLGGLAASTVFKTAAFDHSATPPWPRPSSTRQAGARYRGARGE